MEEDTFTGEALEKALVTDDFPEPGLELLGMMKSSEQKGYVNFTTSGCDEWVDLPTDLIEQAEHVGQSKCKDHSHPLFRLTLKQPESPEARVFSALLAQRMSRREDARVPSGPGPGPLPAGFPGGRHPGGHFGGGLGPTNVAYWPTDGGYQCAGFWDCINMINSESCREVKCVEGWVTGEPVCWCTT